MRTIGVAVLAQIIGLERWPSHSVLYALEHYTLLEALKICPCKDKIASGMLNAYAREYMPQNGISTNPQDGIKLEDATHGQKHRTNETESKILHGQINL